MAGKRQATSSLNHENWDKEEEPEERGTFRKASEDELKNRVIKKARRKVATGNGATDTTDDGAPKSVFSGFAGFGKSTSSSPAASPFSFLSKISATPGDGSNKSASPASFSFGASTEQTLTVEKEDKTAGENGGLAKESSKDDLGKSVDYQSKIKSLNTAVSDWIKNHVDKNPLCILTPIFKDYEKYISEIDEEEKKANQSKTNNNLTNDKKATESSSTLGNFKFSASPKPISTIASTSSPKAMFSFGTSAASTTNTSTTSIFTNTSKPNIEPTKTSSFSFGIKATESKNNEAEEKTSPAAKGFSFGFKADNTFSPPTTTSFTFGKSAGANGDSAEKKSASTSFTPGSTIFSFGNIKPPTEQTPSTSKDTNGDNDEEDQPPIVEFKQVVEEDAIYSKKCKVFVKKDGAFTDRGVGTLYLKPVKDSEKTQLLVRADTNLGNILVNLILSAGIPTQRMGKNNVMMVCLPTPDVEKATSMLLRVKTAEEADELLAELEKHKK